MKSMKRKDIFLKFKNIWIYFLSFFASGVGILLNFVLARVLEVESFGKIQFLVALATTCSQIFLFGLNTYLIREAKNNEQNGEAFNKSVSLFFVIVILLLPIVFFVLNNFVTNLGNDYFSIFIILAVAVLMGINSLTAAYFQGSGKLHFSILFENLIPKSILFFIVLMYYSLGKLNGFEEKYLIFYIIIYFLIAIPLVFFLLKRINFSFNKKELTSIFFFFGLTITYSFGNNLTKVIQGGAYNNLTALGIISVSISIISLVRIFTSVLDNLIKPLFSMKKRENDITGLINSYRFDTRVNSYVSIPLYLFFIIHPDKFLQLFGPTYLAYPNILVILACANAVADVTGPTGTLLTMTGKEKWELFNGILYFAVYIVSIYVFSFDKTYGLCFALLISQIVVNLTKYIEVWLTFKTSPLDLKTVLSLLLILVVNFIIVFALRYINLSLLLWMLVGMITGIFIVFLNFFVLTLYRKSDVKTLIELRL